MVPTSISAVSVYRCAEVFRQKMQRGEMCMIKAKIAQDTVTLQYPKGQSPEALLTQLRKTPNEMPLITITSIHYFHCTIIML